MIKRILKKICKWVFYIIVFLLVMIALIFMSKERQQVESNKQNNPIHRMNNEVLKNHTGDTLYVSYDSREYGDTILEDIIKDMTDRGYHVVNKYTEYLQYQDMNYDFIYIREYTVTHVIYRD